MVQSVESVKKLSVKELLIFINEINKEKDEFEKMKAYTSKKIKKLKRKEINTKINSLNKVFDHILIEKI